MRHFPRLLLLALAVACASPRPQPKPETIEHGLRPPTLVDGDATWSIEERMRQYHVPGLSIAVFGDGKILWAKGYGLADVELNQPVTPETLFQAGSISKPVASVGALVLVERGQLLLQADIRNVLRSWRLPQNEHTAVAPVTLEGLLSHTAGLTVHGFPGYPAGTEVPSVVQVLEGVPPANTAPVRVDLDPGTRWRYSGGGYTLAQLAMTDVTGTPFPELMQELVLGPLHMSASTYEQPLPEARVAAAAAGYRGDGTQIPGKRNVYPEMAAAGLWTTPSDLARFALGLQAMLEGNGGPLTRASAQDMLRERKDHYALGLRLEEPYFTHGGADEGFRALLYAHATKGYGIAMMTNSDSGTELMNEILRSAGVAYAWDEFQGAPVKVAKLAPEQLNGFAGRYRYDEGSALMVSVRGARLEGRLTLRPPFELIPVEANTFVRRDEETRFVFGAEGLQVEEFREKHDAPRLAQGERLLDEQLVAGSLETALEGYRALHAANPEDPVVDAERLDRHAGALLERNDFPAALALLRLIAEFQPDSSGALDRLAVCTEKSGDKAGAIALYRQALELAARPNSPHPSQDATVRAHASARLKALSGGS
jgi:CubicO group peptidase (beta-lactamase class C family)